MVVLIYLFTLLFISQHVPSVDAAGGGVSNEADNIPQDNRRYPKRNNRTPNTHTHNEIDTDEDVDEEVVSGDDEPTTIDTNSSDEDEDESQPDEAVGGETNTNYGAGGVNSGWDGDDEEEIHDPSSESDNKTVSIRVFCTIL